MLEKDIPIQKPKAQSFFLARLNEALKHDRGT